MAFLQAYTDDSASDVEDRRLFMAGYLNSAENWARFEASWAEELAASPSIQYLHMVEANNLRGQFRGWSQDQRNEKLQGLARVIRYFQPVSFEFSASRADYDGLVKPSSPQGIGALHFPCAFGVISTITRYLDREGVRTPVDFIFDRQDGVISDLLLFFDYMKRNLPRGARKLINGSPIFRDDDKLVYPLQAADMLAWHLRREHEGGRGRGSLPQADLLRNPRAHLVSGFDAAVMKRWAKAFDAMPGIPQMQSKGQWQKMRREIVRLNSIGYIPPYGTHWKNFVHWVQESLNRLRGR